MSDGNLSAEQATAAALIRELRSATVSERDMFGSLQQEIRRIARAKMRHERSDHTLQPTALVNEAFIKMYKTSLPADFWDDPSKALRLIAHAMEQILNDHADARNAQKRGGADRRRVPLDENQAREFAPNADASPLLDSELLVAPEQSEKVLAVRELISKLRQDAPRQAEILRLQFHCGLTQDEVAGILGVSVETVKLDTRKAKAFLKARLQER
jgi:RNA polymerase sigma-70 factor, ECF subfamily